MKKGLSGLLVLSISCLTLIIIIALSFSYLASGDSVTVSGNSRQKTDGSESATTETASKESDITNEDHTANEESITSEDKIAGEDDILTETGAIDTAGELSNEDLSNTGSPAGNTLPMPEPAKAASDQSLAVQDTVSDDESDGNSEDEPVLAEFTPEPDMDPDTWDYISSSDANMKYTDKKIPKVMPYEIHVNKAMNCVTVYKANKKGKYTKPVKAICCSAGSATPIGTFKTSDKYYWKAMIHGVWAQYATRITGKFLFHSVPYDYHEKNTLIPSYYNRLGSTASAGCVRMSVEDAKWIIENCPAGTTVVVYNDYSNPGPLGKPSPIRIPYNCTWDPTDPDIRNPWNSDKSTITGVKNHTVERCPGLNLLNGVIAYDIHTKKMSTSKIKIKGKVNPGVPGKYEVKYTFKDSKKKKIKKKCTFTIVDTKAPVISGLPASISVTDAAGINQDYILSMAKITDNGFTLSKEGHASVSKSDNSYIVSAHDDYGHYTSSTVRIIEDSKAPVIKLKKNAKTEYPINQKIDAAWAAKRISKVSDNKTKLSKSDVKISVKPNGWGMHITYSVKDDAGNTATLSENIAYETAQITLLSDHFTVKDIKSKESLAKQVKVTSEQTGKKIPYTLSITHEKTGKDDLHKIYKVTYTATYKSSAGSKKLKAVATVYVDR